MFSDVVPSGCSTSLIIASPSGVYLSLRDILFEPSSSDEEEDSLEILCCWEFWVSSDTCDDIEAPS